MESHQKNKIILTFFLALVGVALIIVSLATDHWVRSDPVLDQHSANVSLNSSRPVQPSFAYFGLFKGLRSKDVGFGARDGKIDGMQLNFTLFTLHPPLIDPVSSTGKILF